MESERDDYGRNTTLIVCKNQYQIDQVKRAFDIEADYIPYLTTITGRKWKKIIVFKQSHFESSIEMNAVQLWLQENIRFSCSKDGEFIIIDC